MTEEELRTKREIFEARKGTTHWPVSVMITSSLLVLLSSLTFAEHEYRSG
jgi:hypothetical protein